MGRKKIIRIPKSAVIKCPNCGKNSRVEMPSSCLFHFKCKKCKHDAGIPQSQCCILCAYGNTECALSLTRKALRKGLEVKRGK